MAKSNKIWLILVLIQCVKCDDYCSFDYPTRIICESNVDFDIREEMQRISANLTEKHFDTFELFSPISNLPENAFYDISFNRINIISAAKLTQIHSQAFSGLAYKLLQYEHNNEIDTELNNYPNPHNIYDAFNSLTNAQELYINLGPQVIHEIPESAFGGINGTQNQLQRLTFWGSFSVSNIGDYAFYDLPYLNWLMFNSVSIANISAHAFDFRNTSDLFLNLYLNNCSLTENSFQVGLFNDSKRPLFIDLRYNQIQYLEEDVFDTFFAANRYNQLNLYNNPLNCANPSKFLWLIRRESELRNRIRYPICKDGGLIWDQINVISGTTFNYSLSIYIKLIAIFIYICKFY